MTALELLRAGAAGSCPRRLATCSDRSGSRRAPCPRPAPPRSPRPSPQRRSASRASASRARLREHGPSPPAHARALGRQARRAGPAPTSNQRLPSAWVSASALNEPAAPRPRRAAPRPPAGGLRAGRPRPRTPPPRSCPRRSLRLSPWSCSAARRAPYPPGRRRQERPVPDAKSAAYRTRAPRVGAKSAGERPSGRARGSTTIERPPPLKIDLRRALLPCQRP